MSAAVTIEKGVAIPGARAGQDKLRRFPFKAMKPGDSFLIRQNGGGKASLEKERVYALLKARQYKMKATSRKVPGGIRVWRVA